MGSDFDISRLSKKVTLLTDVFGIHRDLPLNYVERDNVDDLLFRSLSQKHHIVIHGSSKQGKTCLRKWNLKDKPHILVACIGIRTLAQLNIAVLKEAGYAVEQSQSVTATGTSKISASHEGGLKAGILSAKLASMEEHSISEEREVVSRKLELDPENLNDMIAALRSIDFNSLIILEDFHYLPEDAQREFALALKGYFDYSSYIFIIIGVWLDENRLLRYNGDLGDRVATINADKWSQAELEDVIGSGENVLDVMFDSGFKEYLLAHSFESVWIVQQVCYHACADAGIVGEQDAKSFEKPIGSRSSARALIDRIVNNQFARFDGFLDSFAAGPNQAQAEIYTWVMCAVLASDPARLEGGITVEEMDEFIHELSPVIPFSRRTLLATLPDIAKFQMDHIKISPIILDYDYGARRINVVDRSFLIWLSGQDRVELLRQINMPGDALRKWQRIIPGNTNRHHRK